MSDLPADSGPTAEAVIKASRRITPGGTEEVRHLVLEVQDPGFRYAEGDSIAVLVPPPHPGSNAYHVRRYSIANAPALAPSARATLHLLVRRCFSVDEQSGQRSPGIASGYLCDARVGDRLLIAGPYPGPFKIPADRRADLLMIGTGTGIAPFRAFVERIHGRHGGWLGQIRLYYGGRTGLDRRYANDEKTDLSNYYDAGTFKALKALAKYPLTTCADGLEAHVAEVWGLLQQSDTHVFVSGLDRIAAALDRLLSEQAGSPQAWQSMKQRLIDEHRWSELLYG